MQRKDEAPAGVSSTAQLRATGLSPRGIRRLVREGALRPVCYGVYASAATAASLASYGAPAPRDRRGTEAPQAGRAPDQAAVICSRWPPRSP